MFGQVVVSHLGYVYNYQSSKKRKRPDQSKALLSDSPNPPKWQRAHAGPGRCIVSSEPGAASSVFEQNQPGVS